MFVWLSHFFLKRQSRTAQLKDKKTTHTHITHTCTHARAGTHSRNLSIALMWCLHSSSPPVEPAPFTQCITWEALHELKWTSLTCPPAFRLKRKCTSVRVLPVSTAVHKWVSTLPVCRDATCFSLLHFWVAFTPKHASPSFPPTVTCGDGFVFSPRICIKFHLTQMHLKPLAFLFHIFLYVFFSSDFSHGPFSSWWLQRVNSCEMNSDICVWGKNR